MILLPAALFITAITAAAGNICPGGNSTDFVHDPDPAGSGCNTLITINLNNTVTVTVPDSAPYDGSEDNLVGILNNSVNPLTSLALTGSDIFGLDGDGICRFNFAAANGVSGSSYCTASQTGGTDPQDYYGPTSIFRTTNADSGTVSFSPGVAGGGGKTFFSLEESPSASLGVIVGTAPEPASFGLFAAAFFALVLCHRIRPNA